MTPASIYDIDFNLLGKWLIPKRMRKLRTLAWLRILISPFITVYMDLLRFRSSTLYYLMITPQVCYLEILLNDRYDFTQRRIYITDGLEAPAVYLYQDVELEAVDLYTDPEGQPLYLFTDAEVQGDFLDDFIVMVPASLVFNEAEMRSLVLLRRLPGMRFSIQTF